MTSRLVRAGRWPTACAAITFLVASLPAPFANAQTKPREKVAILDGKIDGVAAETRDRFYAALTEVLEGAGHEVMHPRKAQALLGTAGTLLGCTMGPCLSRIGQVLAVGRVVVVSLTVVGSSYDVTVSLVETERGTPLLQASRKCDVCTLDEGIGTLRRAAVDLVAKEAKDASVQLDHAPLTPEQNALSAQSQPLPVSSTPWYRHRAVPYITLGLAIAAGVAGAILIAGDGCTTNVAPGTRCPETRDTAALGYGMVAGAAVFGLTSVLLF